MYNSIMGLLILNKTNFLIICLLAIMTIMLTLLGLISRVYARTPAIESTITLSIQDYHKITNHTTPVISVSALEYFGDTESKQNFTSLLALILVLGFPFIFWNFILSKYFEHEIVEEEDIIDFVYHINKKNKEKCSEDANNSEEEDSKKAS